MPRPTAQDLAGFWDLLQLSVDDVTAKFDELQKIKRNEWRTVEEPEEKASPLDDLLYIVYTQPSCKIFSVFMLIAILLVYFH